MKKTTWQYSKIEHRMAVQALRKFGEVGRDYSERDISAGRDRERQLIAAAEREANAKSRQ